MKSILIYNSGGGIGDSIQLFNLILSLQNHFKSSAFFYLSSHQNHFEGSLKEFQIKMKNLNLDMKYFGFRWWHYFLAKKKFSQTSLDKIDLIIDLQSKIRNTLILKKIPHKDFYSSTFNFKFCTKRRDFMPNDHIKNLDKFLDIKIKKIEYNLEKLPEKFTKEALRLLPKDNYIGLSLTQGNIYRKKSWLLKNFILLAKEISKRNMSPVFLVEKKEVDLIQKIKSEIPNALFPELLSNLSCPALVTALSKRLKLAISIDNGVMHMIGLAQVPMIVLFGPTDAKKFSPKINSIKVLDSKKIYNSSDINQITVSDVLKLI